MALRHVGRWWVLATVPEWVASLPPESQRVFEYCVGRPYAASGIDGQGAVVLDVSLLRMAAGARSNDGVPLRTVLVRVALCWAKTTTARRVKGSMVVAAVILLSSVCIAPGNSRLPTDADRLRAELDDIRYLRSIINDTRLQQCHSPRRPGELAAALSFNDDLLRSVETM